MRKPTVSWSGRKVLAILEGDQPLMLDAIKAAYGAMNASGLTRTIAVLQRDGLIEGARDIGWRANEFGRGRLALLRRAGQALAAPTDDRQREAAQGGTGV